MVKSASSAIQTYVASDGYACRFRFYPSTQPLRARVVFVHGIQSHGGWYVRSCSRLSEAGFDVSFLDRRGSGLNTDARGDAPSFRRLLDDLADFLGPLRQTSKHSLFLAAISWGGKLATALQRRHPGLVDGLALLCPGFFPRVAPLLRERIAILCARLVAPRKLCPIPLNDPCLFTATATWQRFITQDALSLRQATARLLVESVRLSGYLHWAPACVRVPVLLLLAECDRIIDNASTRQYVRSFASPDQTIIEYPRAHHTLEFEPDPERHVNDLLHWLDRVRTLRTGS